MKNILILLLMLVGVGSALDNLFATDNINGSRIKFYCNDFTQFTIDSVYAIESDKEWVMVRTKRRHIPILKNQIITFKEEE